MLALSLLLCAAGVKAMLGIKIEAIQISDNEYFCADACAFDDAFFQDDGTVCAAKELVVVLDDEGKVDPYGIDYVCAEAADPDWSTRPPKNGAEPDTCDLGESDASSPVGASCRENRINPNKSQNGTEVKVGPLEQLSEVKKMLGLPASQ
ncbi:hypothetical protein MHUMG1_09819 [Metarhizium humberi]|uniref:Uncharacterized protein n=1 Tax=Metarhizium humberi TaxID=2596975 RepID=A0A9P8M2B8_9HYPO|nr:hypothetical protein MHUMG1_09819 [Metarhizium humberi]